ncbi:DUF756 domain-containing protein [Infirmifilum lucidum]|uniref:DUF756 domain-containing protein n=1 Tax=Infirmifilum lucidum TaxID=2776706 RepID=A0A7L9FFJ6_9CREN|nr:phospholipase domain-containing protein [Infirmifilum lucidum]QOJ78560.1 DUF756 domain-containing protein [Infirmifilum lucidum]
MDKNDVTSCIAVELAEAAVLVGVVLVLAIAFAFFVSDFVFSATNIELLDIQYSISGNGTVTLYFRNLGTRPTTVTLVKVNGRPYPQNLYIQPGGTATVTLNVEANSALYDIRVVTSAGTEYPILARP